MTSETRALLDTILTLPDDERAAIASRLVESLDGENFDHEWLVVAKRRLAALQSGSVRGVPGEEVIEAARQRSLS